MNDREYLRSLGFTVGERGRFSKEMLTALASRSEREKDALISDAYDDLGLSLPATPVREAQELYGLTKDGHKVGFIMCSACADHMMWCECPQGVMAPDNVYTLKGAAKGIATLNPRVLQLMTAN